MDKCSLKLTYRKLEFEIELRKRITIIRGDSATGKSLMVKAIEAMELEKGESEYVVLNYRDSKTGYTNFVKMLKDLKGKIIVIDNADIVLDTDMRDFISQDHYNRYIIVGRITRGIKTTPNSLAEIYYDEGDNKFKLSYKYDKKRW